MAPAAAAAAPPATPDLIERAARAQRIDRDTATLYLAYALVAGVCHDRGGALPLSTDTTNFYVEYATVDGGLTITDYTASLEERGRRGHRLRLGRAARRPDARSRGQVSRPC